MQLKGVRNLLEQLHVLEYSMRQRPSYYVCSGAAATQHTFRFCWGEQRQAPKWATWSEVAVMLQTSWTNSRHWQESVQPAMVIPWQDGHDTQNQWRIRQPFRTNRLQTSHNIISTKTSYIHKINAPRFQHAAARSYKRQTATENEATNNDK